jgi:hypothetical protein
MNFNFWIEPKKANKVVKKLLSHMPTHVELEIDVRVKKKITMNIFRN